MTDTTTETVEQMALAADEVWCDLMHLMGRASTEGHKVGQCLAEETRVKLRFMGETLRALAQERDALEMHLRSAEEAAGHLPVLSSPLSSTIDKIVAERDATRAEVEQLKEALRDVASFLPDLDYAKSYLRRLHDMRPAIEHAAQIIAAFAAKENEQ